MCTCYPLIDVSYTASSWEKNIFNYYSTLSEIVGEKREACEILNCGEACDAQEHVKIETSWLRMMLRQNEYVSGAVTSQQFGTEEVHEKVADSASPDKLL